MLQTMFTTATFTDDIYSRDPTTVHLEAEVANLTGHEAGMFVTSGTMGNQICLRTHLTQPPHSVLCDERAHVYTNEAGGLAMFSQALVTPVRPKNGKYITLEEVKTAIVEEDVHHAPTRVVSLENTLHGVVLPYSEAKKISDYIRSEFQGKIKLHLDGTTITNLGLMYRCSFVECGRGRKSHFEGLLFLIRLGLALLLQGVVHSSRLCDCWHRVIHQQGKTLQKSFWRWHTKSRYSQRSMLSLSRPDHSPNRADSRTCERDCAEIAKAWISIDIAGRNKYGVHQS